MSAETMGDCVGYRHVSKTAIICECCVHAVYLLVSSYKSPPPPRWNPLPPSLGVGKQGVKEVSTPSQMEPFAPISGCRKARCQGRDNAFKVLFIHSLISSFLLTRQNVHF